ncbi:MAG: hypothetical protein ACMUEK_02205 [Sodalis sp. (in: enterobacteria)]
MHSITWIQETFNTIDAIIPRLEQIFKQHARDIDWKFLPGIFTKNLIEIRRATMETMVRDLIMLTCFTVAYLGIGDSGNTEQSVRVAVLFICRV